MSGDDKRRGPVLLELGGPSRPPLPERGPAAPDPASDATARGPSNADTSDSSRTPPRKAAEKTRAQRLIEDYPGAAPSPADAPPIEDDPAFPGTSPRAMELVTRLAGSEPPAALKLFINAGGALLTFLLSVAALSFIDGLFRRYPLLGWVGLALFSLFTLATLILAFREWRGFRRLRRIDTIRRASSDALAKADLATARGVAQQLEDLYRHRPELARGLQRVEEAREGSYDAAHLLTATEAALMVPLDRAARLEIEAAARLVAAATAIVPLAFADVAVALIANLRMIRRLAELYGGRAGALGGWRLARTVMTHLVATGAVAASDDLVHTVIGGGALAKLSRRFGEGVINGALTARVGIAAMEVCRPLPFMDQPRPRVTNLVSRGLKGLFGGEN